MPAYMPTREEMEQALEYLRTLNLPADDWVVRSNQAFFSVVEAAGHLFGMSGDAVRGAAERGEIPHAALPNKQAGYRLDRWGLIWYIAQERRKIEQRIVGAAG